MLSLIIVSCRKLLTIVFKGSIDDVAALPRSASAFNIFIYSRRSLSHLRTFPKVRFLEISKSNEWLFKTLKRPYYREEFNLELFYKKLRLKVLRYWLWWIFFFFFLKNSQQLLAVNYFPEKVTSKPATLLILNFS